MVLLSALSQPTALAIPWAEGAVVGALVVAFAHRRRHHGPRAPGTTALWLVALAGSILAGIDLWNWLPWWPHRFAPSPGLGFAGLTPLPSPLHLNLLFQGFLWPNTWALLPRPRPQWLSSVPAWLPHAYITTTIASGLVGVHLVSAGQWARLRRVVPLGAALGAVLGLLALLLPRARAGDIVQLVILLLGLPALALWSRRWVGDTRTVPAAGVLGTVWAICAIGFALSWFAADHNGLVPRQPRSVAVVWSGGAGAPGHGGPAVAAPLAAALDRLQRRAGGMGMVSTCRSSGGRAHVTFTYAHRPAVSLLVDGCTVWRGLPGGGYGHAYRLRSDRSLYFASLGRSARGTPASGSTG